MQPLPSISESVASLRAACFANSNWEIDYFDIRALIEQEREYREIVKDMIDSYRSWQRLARKQRDIRAIFYFDLRGRALYNSIQEHISVWRTIRAERRFLTGIYINQLRK